MIQQILIQWTVYVGNTLEKEWNYDRSNYLISIQVSLIIIIFIANTYNSHPITLINLTFHRMNIDIFDTFTLSVPEDIIFSNLEGCKNKTSNHPWDIRLHTTTNIKLKGMFLTWHFYFHTDISNLMMRSSSRKFEWKKWHNINQWTSIKLT